MSRLTKKDLPNLEEYYYWSGNRDWIPFPKELKEKIPEIYGEEPLPYSWSEQDIHEGTRKIIMEHWSTSELDRVKVY